MAVAPPLGGAEAEGLNQYTPDREADGAGAALVGSGEALGAVLGWGLSDG